MPLVVAKARKIEFMYVHVSLNRIQTILSQLSQTFIYIIFTFGFRNHGRVLLKFQTFLVVI